jgi:integrase
VENLDGPGGYLHVVDGKGDKQRTSILPKPVLDALNAHLQGRDNGYIFEGRDQGHIFTRQIQRLLDEAAEKAGLQQTRQGNVRQRKRITPNQISGLISSQQKKL